MLSYLLLLPAALTLASPTGNYIRDELPSELLLRYHHESGSNQTEFTLSTLDKSDFYAHACDNSFGIAGKAVTINVDARGSGHIAVDDKEYKVVGDRDMSGGISCTKMYNEKSTVVECSIPWRDSFDDWTVLSADEVEECFSEESAARRRNLPSAFSSRIASSHFVSDSSPALDKRQGGCAYSVWYDTRLIGDGDPHQDYFHKQVGPAQTCAQRGTCFVGVGEEVSITISAELGTGGGPTGWITGGFSVSQTKSSSTERGCYGEAGDTVCQWSKTHHTAYTVQTKKYVQSRGCGTRVDEDSGPYVIRSPNENSMAVEWYCVLNTCRGDGDRYWELGRAGGP
ncbi:hypothetical protein B0J13DRAFT_255304 [Dactylonectria estremocensis]|uniref:Uncharacterized protein n=1 Tax=Dactylonectria estremocensis TaxID=1079267 RepID=A0A9P9F380_9HYPO|nr:hypothetical protein B0J13DRAFT_255304 [Dactylonectria estremocensis]